MSSNIDVTVPAYGTPTTASVRNNFSIVKSEIEALQALNSAPVSSLVSPVTVDVPSPATAATITTTPEASELDLVSSADNGVWVFSAPNGGTTSPEVGIGSGSMASSGDSGTTWVYSGGAANGSSGQLMLQSGPASGAGNHSGDVILDPGPASGGAERGWVKLNAFTELRAGADSYAEIDIVQDSITVGRDPGLFFNTKNPGSYAAWIMSSRDAAGRWEIDLGDNTPETGGNTGSNFTIVRYGDDGTELDKPLEIERATGRLKLTAGARSASLFWHPTDDIFSLRTDPLASGDSPKVFVYSGITTGNTGEAWIYSGDTQGATSISGDAGFGSGNTLNGTSGVAWIWTGNASGGSTGNIDIRTGSANGAGKVSGDIVLAAGNATGGATRGAVKIDGEMHMVSGSITAQASPGVLIGASGPSIRSGTGPASGTQPAGSLWLRTDGATGSRLYVSAGGGTWNAVAGV